MAVDPAKLQLEISKWQSIVDTLDISEIPTKMFDKIRINLANDIKYVFPIREWVESGVDSTTIELTIEKWLEDHYNEIVKSEYVVNIDRLKELVEPITRDILKDL